VHAFFRVLAIAKAMIAAVGAPQRSRALRSFGKTRMDADFLDFAFHDDHAAIATALAAAVGREPQALRLIGSKSRTDELCVALTRRGHQIERLVWSYADPIPASGIGAGILCEVPKTFDDWSKCAALTANGSIEPIWRLVLPWSLLREMLSIYEYNAATLSDLIEVYRGRSKTHVGHRENARLQRVEEFLPLAGKTIIEFGPSDGNQTADLLALGAAHVLAVEGRPENVVKLLVVKWLMGWRNLDVVLDNFQSPGSWARRRYDFVYAQGVYYHCQNPLLFLDMLTRLGDSIFIGGWTATDEKPRSPWISLEHDGRGYRGKVYTESYHFLSGLAEQSYMLDRSEIERFLTERGFLIKYCDVSTAENGLSTEFTHLLAMRDSSSAGA
jgi:hypothetical protein